MPIDHPHALGANPSEMHDIPWDLSRPVRWQSHAEEMVEDIYKTMMEHRGPDGAIQVYDGY